MFVEQVERVHQLILIAKETVDDSPRIGSESLLLHLPIALHQGLVDIELLDAILSGVEELLLARQSVGRHRVGDAQGRVHADAVETIELFRIHAAHRGADDEVGVFLFTDIPEQCHRLMGFYGQVVGDNLRPGKHLAQPFHRSTLCRRAEAVHIHNLLSLHQIRKLLDILVLFHHCLFIFRSRPPVSYSFTAFPVLLLWMAALRISTTRRLFSMEARSVGSTVMWPRTAARR